MLQVNFEIPIFEGQIDADVVDKWLNLLEGYFSVHDFSSQEKVIFALLKVVPHVKDWWETYCEQKDESTGSLFSAAPTWNSFQDAIKEQYYPVKSYEDKYIEWTMLRQGRDQDVQEFTNIFHTLRTQLGIKDSELHLKFKQKKRDFGSGNPKQGKGFPKLQNQGQSQDKATQDNSSENNNTIKSKKDIGKWCEFHKSPTHNTSECWTKQSLVVELKASKSDAYFDPESEPNKGNGKGKQMIDAEPSTTNATTKIQKNEPEDLGEGEHLFHSKMWVKGSSLQFIFDSGSRKNLISAEVMKRLGLPTTPHLQPYSIGWLHQG
eukprot:PITA_35123